MKSVHLKQCKVCLSHDIQDQFVTSKKAFMSMAGFNHSLCLNCKSVFLNPRPNQDELNQFYTSTQTEKQVEEQIAYASVNRIIDPEKRLYFIENRVNPISKYIKQEAKIFDVGCGTGAFVKIMKELGYPSIKGCDLSQSSLEVGEKHLGLTDQDVFKGGIEDIPEKDYDLITAWTIIEHLLEPEAFLKDLHQKIKSQGYLLLEFPTVDSLMFTSFPEDFQWLMPPYHTFLYSLEGMKNMLSRNGFELQEVHQMPNNWGFFDVLAKKASLSEELKSAIKEKAPSLVYELDLFFDKLSLERNQSSSVQLISQKKDA